MSVDATMAVLYAQTSLATPFANAAAVGPQAAVAMSRILAAEMARQERQQVEKISKPDQQANITDEKRGGGRGGLSAAVGDGASSRIRRMIMTCGLLP